MSGLDLDAIEARAEKATDGPWDSYTVPATRKDAGHCAVEAQDIEIRIARYEGGFFDADFIAHARTDVPALVARIRELEATMEQVRGVHPMARFGYPEPFSFCLHCQTVWPCVTARTLDWES